MAHLTARKTQCNQKLIKKKNWTAKDDPDFTRKLLRRASTPEIVPNCSKTVSSEDGLCSSPSNDP